MDTKEICLLLTSSLTEAMNTRHTCSEKKDIHRARSATWVSTVARRFEDYYSSDSDIRVFHQNCHKHRTEFGCNELLHDITVARVATVAAPRNMKQLSFIVDVLWQVESEFARNGRELLFDFNQLILGSAKYKLFIFSDISNQGAFLNMLNAPARRCTGDIPVAMVSHPDRWDDLLQPEVYLWRLFDGEWQEHMRMV